LTSTAII